MYNSLTSLAGKKKKKNSNLAATFLTILFAVISTSKNLLFLYSCVYRYIQTFFLFFFYLQWFVSGRTPTAKKKKNLALPWPPFCVPLRTTISETRRPTSASLPHTCCVVQNRRNRPNRCTFAGRESQGGVHPDVGGGKS